MLQEIEREIRKLLIQKGDLKNVSEALWKYLDKKNLNSQTLEVISSFFYHAHEYDKVVLLAQRQLYQKGFVPWNYLLETILKVTSPSKQRFILEQCIDYFRDPKNEIPYLYSKALDALTEDVIPWRQFHIRKKQRETQANRQSILDQLNLFKYSEKSSESEKKMIERLSRLYPADFEIKQLKQKVYLKDYKTVLEKYNNDYQKHKYSTPAVSIDEQKILNSIFLSCETFINFNKNSTELTSVCYDLVYCFIFLESFQFAKQLALQLPPSDSKNWLLLEISILAEDFSMGLSLIDTIESNEKLIENSETVWTIHYYRAQCLWGLNQKQRAILAMERIVSLNPEFRIASRLLHEWKETA